MSTITETELANQLFDHLTGLTGFSQYHVPLTVFGNAEVSMNELYVEANGKVFRITVTESDPKHFEED